VKLNPAITGINIQQGTSARIVEHPLSSADNWQAGPQEFSMQVPGVGDFYAKEGNYIEYFPAPGADPEWIKLYLNGQVLAALLHQRKILNFHASSFIYKGHGMMLLGEAGSGKSSLTAAFTLNDAGFLSDDFTPVIFKEGIPVIWPVYKSIKIREQTISQLGIVKERLRRAEKGTGKYFLEVYSADVDHYPLDFILKIEVSGTNLPIFSKPEPTEAFTLLRSEICSWEMLAGMPETEAAYLQQLLKILRQVKFVRVVRPVQIETTALHDAVRTYLEHI
jgi:hypothetical protein